LRAGIRASNHHQRHHRDRDTYDTRSSHGRSQPERENSRSTS
jgi:hypothetical protein